MDTSSLPILLGLAVLLPLGSFFTLLAGGRRIKPAASGYVATAAIVGALVLSLWSAAIWIVQAEPQHTAHDESAVAARDSLCGVTPAAYRSRTASASATHATPATDSAREDASASKPRAGDFYVLGTFGDLRLTIGYYIDSLTVVMFLVVTVIASCIHFYSMGYMQDEEHALRDREVVLRDGSVLERRGRYGMFFQYLSLFCFSMLGLVLAGNLLMVFVFWELVGICSYFLIGFYFERQNAANAANKAFLVNRIGDFGMLVGMMVLWGGLGTFAFGDRDANGNGVVESSEQGIFAQVRSAGDGNVVSTPVGMLRFAARDEIAQWMQQHPDEDPLAHWNTELERRRRGGWNEPTTRAAYGWLILAGIGIFCGCVGKSAQFPLHIWLPDAMEGPTPVSALVHSATMVAAGVYLVGRLFPVFTPEVLLVIALVGVITLLLAATIAITATDIKRVLAYSTVSQLGFMMLALGLGGWLAGMMHLVTHAFFKSLLFLCAGSVIHAVHTNDMTEMGGLLKRMPYTAYTMLVGCLAISGISIPFLIGFSGYYSKDMILEQAFAFLGANPAAVGSLFFVVALGVAAITAFYMFRLWFMTFTGAPRDAQRYDHAHEAPRIMTVPLIILAVFAACVAWRLPFVSVNLESLLEAARPAGTANTVSAARVALTWPSEHVTHAAEQFSSIKLPVTFLTTASALAGIVLAAAMYHFHVLDPREVSRQFAGVYRFLRNKWWFDELYEWLFVRRIHQIARAVAAVDRCWVDGLVDGLAVLTARFARLWETLADRLVVDRLVNLAGRYTYSAGLSLRRVQTGSLRQYVMFLVLAAIAGFLLASWLWPPTAGG